MANCFGRHVGRWALFLASALAVLVFLCAGPAHAQGESIVRMAVDPTVLPPVLPPEGMDKGVETPPAAAKPSAAAQAGSPEKTVPGEADLAPEGTTPAPSAKPEPPIVTVVEPPLESAPKEAPAQEAKPAPQPPAAKPAPAQAAKPIPGVPGTVRRVTLTSTDHGFTLTLACDRPVGDTTYMNLASPRRLVVDLRQPWKLGTRNVARAATGMVRHVVAGEHPDRLRFVVHFRTPPKGALSPEFRRVGNTLTVTVKTD